jgi:predicted lipid-binding transport protein (Tim44 family)
MMFVSFAPFLARAGGGIGGGGHSSSGGGSHISSGGSHTFFGGGGVSTGGGGTGGGDLVALFIFVPIVLLVLIFVFLAHRRSRRSATSPSWSASAAQSAPSPRAPGPPSSVGGSPVPTSADHLAGTDADAGLAAIKAHDPGFDEDTFLATVERCFFAVEEAWSQQKPDLSRPVMTEDAWQRQKAEIESYRSSGRRNVLENLTVAKATIVAAGSDDGHDVATVRFRAASANYDVDVASGKVAHGNKQMAFWEQDWVFQRSSQALTGGESAGGQRCPNCGAPLDLDIAGVCKNCKASVSGGDGEWLVVRADQAQHVPS